MPARPSGWHQSDSEQHFGPVRCGLLLCCNGRCVLGCIGLDRLGFNRCQPLLFAAGCCCFGQVHAVWTAADCCCSVRSCCFFCGRPLLLNQFLLFSLQLTVTVQSALAVQPAVDRRRSASCCCSSCSGPLLFILQLTVAVQQVLAVQAAIDRCRSVSCCCSPAVC